MARRRLRRRRRPPESMAFAWCFFGKSASVSEVVGLSVDVHASDSRSAHDSGERTSATGVGAQRAQLSAKAVERTMGVIFLWKLRPLGNACILVM